MALDVNLPVGFDQGIFNAGSNALLVYPPIGSGGSIGGGASVSLPVNGFAVYTHLTANSWVAKSGSGSGGGGGGSIPATGGLLCTSGVSGTAVACPSLVGISANGAVQYGHAGNQAVQGSDVGAANGVAGLDSGANVTAAELALRIAAGGALCSDVAGQTLLCVLHGLSYAAGGNVAVQYGFGSDQAIEGTQRGLNSGVAELDSAGHVPLAEIVPSLLVGGTSFGWTGLPVVGALRQFVLPYDCNLSANLAGWQTYANTTGTSSATFAVTLIQSGTPVSLGNITFGSGSHTGTLPTFSATPMFPGDVLQVLPPATQDATLADVAITATCTKAQ